MHTGTDPSTAGPTDAEAEAEADEASHRPWQVKAALAVVVLAIGVAVVLGLVNKANPLVTSGPLPVATVGQPDADSAACKTLLPRLPAVLAGLPHRIIVGGGDGIAAWGDPPIILRCGLETPEDLTCSSALIQINGVSWLEITTPGLGDSTYIAADRSIRVAVTVPVGTGTGPIQQVSDVVSATLKVRPPCVNGVLLPTDTK